jgi:ABC-type Fe3+-citrate transport system substrate-binding protein
MQKLSDQTQEFQALIEQEKQEMDAWWESLSKEDQMKAFYSVVSRIVKGELEDQGSYRYVLYNVFGFDADAYIMGMNCGFMALHNAIPLDVKKMSE